MLLRTVWAISPFRNCPVTRLLLKNLIQVTTLSLFIMENQREKKKENEMDTGGIFSFKELDLSYYIGEAV